MTEQNSKSAFNLEVLDNGVGIIRIDVPNESMNVLKAEFAEQVEAIFAEVKSNSAVKSLVLTSGKDNSFVAGADVKVLDSCSTQDEVKAIAQTGQQLFDQIEGMKMPIIAAIHGPALGGGLELAMACHGRVVSDSSKTVLGLPEVQLGLLPGSGGTQRLPKLVGLQKALDMMLTGKQLRAKQALKAGLVDDMVPVSILLETAIEMALKGKPKRKPVKRGLMSTLLENNPFGRKVVFDQAAKQVMRQTNGNYPAPIKIIECIRTGIEVGYQQGLDIEAQRFSELCMTAESKALRSLFFATTEMKKETGVAGVDPLVIKKAGVLGGGLMGGGIAFVTTTKAGVPARIKDIAHEGIRNAFKYSYDILNKKVKRRFMSSSEMQKQLSLLSASTDFVGFKDSDIVVEAVFEDLTLKQKMVADIEENCKESTIFASNTSSLPIREIAAKAARPENVIGLHYFSPVDKMPLVEVIATDKTSDLTISTTVEFARRQGKTPIVVKDEAGFFVNRILGLYMNEAANIVMEGEPVEKIDKALTKFGFPVGPMTLLDEVGIDVGVKVSSILFDAFGERFTPPAAMEKLMADDRKGKKNQNGFYLYGKAAAPSLVDKLTFKRKSKQVDESVYRVLGITPSSKMSSEDIAERCVIQLLNEAARCLDEGIVRSARDGDIGMIFGTGYPPFQGGPFKYMDSYGIDNLVATLKKHQEQFGDRFAPCDSLVKMAEEGKTFY
ncbi:fatty acid oxidation complex subunit alpha FadJ [Psychrosphaera sp. 1_MG-2023]|uniref:fatty acid oxidation complex subunit alpha FadJ n=1 Tax=Psychrosphaera sp. 1_MG-2023 TaxID=3062643 RepID=UPI0026E2295E|nr:fatty acid oxidation complex subunit alpha FadJ [Psychrosphaera sp. 1_MG-2023]MDO6719504.1 fatty acid oxidation complex subunit alpha FadJ [Psychrosphaera sp. 1_MG-2023]